MSKVKSRWAGRGPMIVGFTALTGLVVTFGVWGTQARIAGAVIAPGLVEVESNRQVIQHPEGGVVGAILAKDGDFVTAGQTLVRFDDADYKSELSITNGRFFELKSRIARFQAERDNKETITFGPEILADDNYKMMLTDQQSLFDARRRNQKQQIAQIEEQIVQTNEQTIGIDAQIEANSIQQDLLKEELDTNKALKKKGLLKASTILAQRRTEAELKGQFGSLIAEKSRLKSLMAAYEIEKLRLTTNRQEEAIGRLRDLEAEIKEIEERRRILLRKLSLQEVTTPVSGIVYGSEVFALQSVVSPAQPIMYIVPKDEALVIRARIAAPDVDQITIGQDVILRFSNFDARFTPEIIGSIQTVSADIVQDQTTGLSFYEASVLPKPEELTKLGDQTLLPGMPVEAYIKTTDRSPLNYLVKPLADYFYRAFREQ